LVGFFFSGKRNTDLNRETIHKDESK
jgi:hypothetical protein